MRSRGWTRSLPNVYLLPGVPQGDAGRLRAALLWAGEGAVLSHNSAAWAHGLDGAGPLGVPELYVFTGRSAEGIRTRRVKSVRGLEVMTVKGLRVTRVERTLSDVAGSWVAPRAGRAMDDALRRGLTSLARLAAEAEKARIERRSGASTFRRLVTGRDHRDPKVRSRFETLTLALLEEIESPEPNHRVPGGRTDYYLDFAYPSLLLGIECQSIRWHLGEEAFRSDMARHRHLSTLGWVILFVCWDDVVFNRERLKQELVEALKTRRTFMRPELPMS